MSKPDRSKSRRGADPGDAAAPRTQGHDVNPTDRCETVSQDASEGSEDSRSHHDAAPSAGPLPGGLYVLATPIGAAGDLTLRGRDALSRADALACEDARVLRRLMDLHGVRLAGRPLIVYHDHNADAARPKIMALLEAGRSVVYASDAGTPLIADPGYRLVDAAHRAGVAVSPLPGPSALLAALSVAGLPTDKFCFGGFPPPKSTQRRRAFEHWRDAPGTLVFYEAPHRLAASLADMAAVFGARPAAVARELTKRFEEVRRGDLESLAAAIAAAPVKGEIVVLIGPPPEKPDLDLDRIDAELATALEQLSVKDAARTVAEQMSAPKKIVYERAILIKQKRDKPG